MNKIITIDVPELVASVNEEWKEKSKKFTEENVVYAIERSGCILDPEGRIALTDPFKDDIHFRMSLQYPAYLIGSGVITKPYSEEDKTIQINFHFNNWKAAAYSIPKMTRVKMKILDTATYVTDDDGMVYYPYEMRPPEQGGGNEMLRVKVGPPNSPVLAIARARLIPDIEELGIDKPNELERRKQPSVMEI